MENEKLLNKRVLAQITQSNALLAKILIGLGEGNTSIALEPNKEFMDELKNHRPKVGVDFFTEKDKAEMSKALVASCRPVKGVDYFTEKDISEFKREVTPRKGIDYVDGYTPVKGTDYFTAKEIKDFLKKITPKKGVHYRDGKDAKVPSVDQLVKQVVSLTKDARTDREKALEIVRLLESLIPKRYNQKDERLRAAAIRQLPVYGGGGGDSGGGGTVTPSGPTGAIQFNSGSGLGGTANLSWNNASQILNLQAATTDGSTLSQRWMDSNGDARAYVASNGDAFFNHITAGDLVDGPVKSSGGSLTNSAIDLNSTDVTGVLQVTKGGTGLSAFASGDIIYASAANTLSARAIGSSGDILTVSGGFPVWASTSSLLDGTYLKLDTTNGPLTGNLFVTKTDAKLRATDNTGSINYSELFANSTEVGFNFSIIDGESTGAIRYDGVSFSLSTNLSDAYTFSSSALLYYSGTSSSTQPAFYIIGDRAISGTNTNGGDVVITPGISRGSGTSKSILQASGGGASGTAESNPTTVATFAKTSVTLADGYSILSSATTTGIKIGGASDKLGFFSVTPVAKQGATVDLGTALSNLGLRTAGTAYPITTSGAVSFSGTIALSGQVTMGSAINIATNTGTGTQIATTVSQKLAFHGSTAVIQRAGAAQAAVATTAATNTTPFGYTTQAQADAIVTLVNEIRAALVEKGLIKGAA